MSETDLISRRDAIDCAKASPTLETTPSAQPEKRTEERTETHACDLISRQAAIDALLEEVRLVGLVDSYYVENDEVINKDDAIEAIRLVPSAQPEEASMILGTSKDGVRLWYKCSVCGEPANADDNYCCNCGRKFING